jgi:hypothetical protein
MSAIATKSGLASTMACRRFSVCSNWDRSMAPRRRRASTAARRSLSAKGLTRKSSAPCSMLRRISFGSFFPVIKMKGMVEVVGFCFRASKTSWPVPSGISTSQTIKPGAWALAARMASRQLPASSTTKPSACRVRRIVIRSDGSSSMTRIVSISFYYRHMETSCVGPNGTISTLSGERFPAFK